jgi:hypothetical protein
MPSTHKRYRCRCCGAVLPAWFAVAKQCIRGGRG